MQKVSLLILFLAIITSGCTDDATSESGDEGACSLGTYDDRITITNQEGVAELSGYTAISGALWIREEVTDLNALECLTTVGSDLLIQVNNEIHDLRGLHNIETVAGNLFIGAPGLTSLDGLTSLESVESLTLTLNPDLSSLDGLDALTTVKESIDVYANKALPDCDVCDFLKQLVVQPEYVMVDGNLRDSCTPFEDNCM